MKTITFGLCLAMASTFLQAQEEVIIQTDETPVVYDSPVVYESQVTYNAPVIYNAPVFYMNATSPASMAYTAASTASCVYQPTYQSSYYSGYSEYERRSPNVIIMGKGAYYTSYDTTPNVIIVGSRGSSTCVTPARGFRSVSHFNAYSAKCSSKSSYAKQSCSTARPSGNAACRTR